MIIMKDDDIVRRKDVELALLDKGQRSRRYKQGETWELDFTEIREALADVPAAQPERLTDCDFETIRIHMNAYKEKLCNQQRWKEAEEYQRIIDRFMAFASAQPERKKGKWKVWNILDYAQRPTGRRVGECPFCGYLTGEFRLLLECSHELTNFCSNCGADMRGEQDG